MDLNYPDFTLANYRRLIGHLKSRWQILRLCDAAMDPFGEGILILRHDIDFSPSLALPMAEVEYSMGIRSTYFVALHLYYNLHLPMNANAIKSMAQMGHEIGLHYDNSLYAEEVSLEEKLASLDSHIQILQQICRCRVLSIASHNPSTAKLSDPFRNCVKYNNAYDNKFFQNTVYTSDSCRAWRAGGLKRCWCDPRPRRLYLLIHPELWGATTEVDRMAYLEVLRSCMIREYDTFFDDVRSIWRNHSGGREYDERIRLQRRGK
jgi:hypothetical protein